MSATTAKLLKAIQSPVKHNLLFYLSSLSFSNAARVSSGISISSPGFVIPGYRQALIIFLIFSPCFLKSLYIIQISPGADLGFHFAHFLLAPQRTPCVLLLGLVFITAINPGTIAFSFLSGLRKMPRIFEEDSPYCF